MTISEIGRDYAELAGGVPVVELDELAVTRMRVDAALAAAPLIAATVERRADRRIIIADVVTCWQALSQAVRHRYETSSGADRVGLDEFCADYVHEVERVAFDGIPNADSIGFTEGRDVTCTAWERHVEQLRDRLNASMPPPPEWLRLFPPEAADQ